MTIIDTYLANEVETTSKIVTLQLAMSQSSRNLLGGKGAHLLKSRNLVRVEGKEEVYDMKTMPGKPEYSPLMRVELGKGSLVLISPSKKGTCTFHITSCSYYHPIDRPLCHSNHLLCTRGMNRHSSIEVLLSSPQLHRNRKTLQHLTHT